ncbi:ABC transporter substrate-binding protein [Rosenbergiella collisarenosi]|uniref:ABC transporter substrate-binding protein n=1 Tax=Rosenbergiella collisarenosi TaxID=1544695 RepID=UPI001F4F5C74
MRLPLSLLIATLFTSASYAATPPNSIVVAIPLDGIISFDPAESFETVSTSSLVNIYQGLIRADRDHPQTIVPASAASWTAGSQPRSLRFTLKPSLHFASGNPLRADDVIYSLSRAVKLNKAPVFILGEFGWTPENIDASLHKISDTEVEITWQSDIGQDLALRLLSAPVASIVDSKVVSEHQQAGDYGNNWLKNHSAGSAAYSIQQYVPQQALLLQKNPYSDIHAKIDHVLLKGVPDASARRLLLTQGDADIAYGLGPDQFATLRHTAGVKVATFPSSLVYYLGFNTQDRQQPALANPALWQAARWLVDYNGLSQQLLKGQYQVHQSFLPVGFDGALEQTPFSLDVQKAKQILTKAGIKPGTSFTLAFTNQPPYSDIAQALQASFAKADIVIKLQPVPEAELWGKMRSRQFQSIFTYWGADYIDPNTNASTFAYNVENGPKTLAWRVGWSIPQLSQLTKQAAATSDATKRRELYRQIQTTVMQDSPFVVALQGAQQVGLRDNVKGAQQSLGVSMLYFDQITK